MPDHADHLALEHIERDLFERLEFAEALADLTDGDERRHQRPRDAAGKTVFE